MKTILIFILGVHFISANDLYNLDDRFHSSNFYFSQDSINNEDINESFADINNDQNIDILDVIQLVNMILN